ncbi:MAG TPA: dienelactone hydrolase family protein [Pseudolabrys sp.]|nr:dienelactone hydrolase family protein [Pseudolabrys sp.]
MPAQTVKIKSGTGGEFDCYLALPSGADNVPAVVLASAVHGVDKDLRAIADVFAAHGVIAAAPDLFWRTIPGPLTRADGEKTTARSQPRGEKVKTGEADMADTLRFLRTLKPFNGRAAAMGFCYGGPYAILGPKRLGYAAGISCHGSRMQDYVGELDGVSAPLCIIWGDDDHQAPPDVLAMYRKAAERFGNLELHIFPAVKHGYMMPDAGAAYDAKTREFSLARALAMLDGLRGGGAAMKKAS